MSANADGHVTAVALQYGVIDALSKLFLYLIRLADRETGDVRVNLLSRILSATARVLSEDHEEKRTSNSPVGFDQRPYHRLLFNLSDDMGVPDMQRDQSPSTLPLMMTYSQVYLLLQPSTLPGFAFGWLQLVSQKSYMPHMLLAKDKKAWHIYHRLLLALLHFLQPFLRAGQLAEPIRKLYEGTLRVLLVLLHDFPDFLSEYHLSLCDAMPAVCVQMRNLVLSAYPRSCRPPDSMVDATAISLLPEMQLAPRLIPDVTVALNECGLRMHIDSYMTSKQPLDLMSLISKQVLNSANGGYVSVSAQARACKKTYLALHNPTSLYLFLIGACDINSCLCW